MRSAVAIAIATSVAIALVMLVFGKPILGCFISGTPEEAAVAMDAAYAYLAILSLCLMTISSPAMIPEPVKDFNLFVSILMTSLVPVL